MRNFNIDILSSTQQCPECLDEFNSDQASSSEPVNDQYTTLFRELEDFSDEWLENEKFALCTDHASTAKSSDVNITDQAKVMLETAEPTILENHHVSVGTRGNKADDGGVLNSQLISEFETYFTQYGRTIAKEGEGQPGQPLPVFGDVLGAPMTCEEIIDTLEALSASNSQAGQIAGIGVNKQREAISSVFTNMNVVHDTHAVNNARQQMLNPTTTTIEQEFDYQSLHHSHVFQAPASLTMSPVSTTAEQASRYQPLSQSPARMNKKTSPVTSCETCIENISKETRGRKRRSYELSECEHIKDEKERKKVQNVFYARRYRYKKRVEADNILAEEAMQIEKNKELRMKAGEIESEVKMLKKLMLELCRKSSSKH